MRLHVGAEDGVDASLVAALLAEPAEQVGVQPHGHNFFWCRHHDFGAFPEFGIRGMGVGVGRNPFANAGRTHAAQLARVRARAALGVWALRL